jgi:hypothetical protein
LATVSGGFSITGMTSIFVRAYWPVIGMGVALEGKRGKRKKSSPKPSCQWDVDKRNKLIKVLGVLGSSHDGERANAAQQAERIRKEAGLTGG